MHLCRQFEKQQFASCTLPLRFRSPRIGLSRSITTILNCFFYLPNSFFLVSVNFLIFRVPQRTVQWSTASIIFRLLNARKRCAVGFANWAPPKSAANHAISANSVVQSIFLALLVAMPWKNYVIISFGLYIHELHLTVNVR